MTTLEPIAARPEFSILRWKYMVPLAAFVVASIGDVLTTQYVPRGWTGVEADPLAAWVFNHFGNGTIVLPMLLVPILVVVVLKFANRYAWSFIAAGVVAVLYFAAAAHGLEDVHNIVVASYGNGHYEIFGRTVVNHSPLARALLSAPHHG